MAIVTAMIPAGFGPEKKARFISETKNALCEAFDCHSNICFVFSC